MVLLQIQHFQDRFLMRFNLQMAYLKLEKEQISKLKILNNKMTCISLLIK
jgi:hypothetical protein